MLGSKLVRTARTVVSRPLVLHPGSIAIGALGCGVLLLSMSQTSLSQAPMPLRVEYMPHPRDIFRIEEGAAPYIVPAGKILVIMGGGNRDLGTSGFTLSANSHLEWLLTAGIPYPVEAPRFLTYQPGDVLAVSNPNYPTQTHAYAYGYLVNQ